MTDEIGYAEALAELESILAEIEDDAVDVDVLAARVKRGAELLRICRSRITAAKVKRGAELLRICRGRINAARVEVTQVVAELDPDASND